MNRNTYRHTFVSRCPENLVPITYHLEIVAHHMIMVEKIVAAVAVYEQAHHEKLADDLATQFPGTRQTLRAYHHGVGIETVRGAI